MPSKDQAPAPPGSLALGLSLVLAAALAGGLAFSIKTIGLGDSADPGPRALPFALSLLLAAGGIWELASTRRSPRRSGPGASSGPDRAALARLAPILGLFLAYILILPWTGFALATLVTAPLMMVALGNSWKLAVPVTLGILALVYLLFVSLFKVPLPGGIFNLPF